MPVTFDGPNLRIILPSGAMQNIDAEQDLYSAWKVWVKTGDNAKYLKAFDATGGDPITASEDVAPFFFLRNDLGWRIRGPEEDATITISGNLFGRDGTLPMLVPTLGNYTQQITFLVSSRALVEGSDPTSIRDAVYAKIIEGSYDLEESMRLIMSVLLGKNSGVGTGVEHFRDTSDTKDRVVTTLDQDNNRTNVVLDPL